MIEQALPAGSEGGIMRKLNRRYQEADRYLALLYYQLHSRECMAETLFLPTDEGLAELRERLQKLECEVEGLEDIDAVFSMVKHHFLDFCDTLHYEIADAEVRPESCVLGFREHLQHYVINDRRPDEVRLQAILLRVRQMVEAEETWLALYRIRKDQKQQKSLARSLAAAKLDLQQEPIYLQGYFPSFTADQIKAVSQAIRQVAEMQGRLAEALGFSEVSADELKQDDLSLTVKMEPEAYRTLLAKQMGVSLDELLNWHEEEMNRTRAEVFSIAAGLDIPEPAPKTMQEVSDILLRYAGPCGSAEEMYERANAYLKRTRKVAHENVTLPEDENCICVELPVCYKDGYPWGGYEGGDFHVRPFLGHMFLNQYNYQNITDGWIKVNALHEAYPGHHVQYVRAAVDTTPETVKIGSKLIPLLEGTCLRTERGPLRIHFRRIPSSRSLLPSAVIIPRCGFMWI